MSTPCPSSALGRLPPVDFRRTFRAGFGPVGAGGEQRPTYAALSGVQPVEPGRFQFPVRRQHRPLEPPAQQAVGNGLNADTFLPIVRRDTVAAVAVTARMRRPPRPPVPDGAGQGTSGW